MVLPLPVGWLSQPHLLLLGGPEPLHPSSPAPFPGPCKVVLDHFFLEEQVSWAIPGQAASSEGWEPGGRMPWVQNLLSLRACDLCTLRPECGRWSYYLQSLQ